MNPPLNEDQLIADYLTGEMLLAGVAARHHLTLSQLIDWAERPETKARLDTLHRLITRRAETIAANARAAAMNVLQTIATTYMDPLESRRAASAIVRATNPLPVIVRRRPAAVLRHGPAPAAPPRPAALTFKLSPVRLTNPPNLPTPLADTPPGTPARPEPAPAGNPADAPAPAPCPDADRTLPTFTFEPNDAPATPGHPITNGHRNGVQPDRPSPDTG